MLKKTISYTDYNGTERKEDFFFNLTEAELTEMQLEKEGGLEAYLKKIVAANDAKEIMKTFKAIILKAYGEKSEDGKRFIKSQDISDAFSQTEAYSILFMELATDADKAAEFINGIIPAKARQNVAPETITKE